MSMLRIALPSFSSATLSDHYVSKRSAARTSLHLLRRAAPVIGAVLLFAGLTFSQDPRGSIRGQLTDPTGAVLAGAEIRATNVDNGVAAAARTNEAGRYNAPFLPAGTYRITAELAGFKRLSRSGVEVRVGEVVEVDLQMQLGALAESIEVAAETPLLDTVRASLGQVIDRRRILELPTSAGNPLELTLLTPGMVEPSKFLWKAAWNFRDVVSDGNPRFTTEYQVDGVSNTYAEGNQGRSRYAFAPPATAVREFKMETSPYDASVGHTMSSVVNVSTIGGTNELHGELHWVTRNSAFGTPNFFNNKFGTKPPVFQDNRYGASAGGPVYLPKLYNGKNKTFWHHTWEANKWGNPEPTFTAAVPTAAQRQGDFSQLLRLGSVYQIYDPATIATAPRGRFSRQPFANNVIPTNRLDEVGKKLAQFYPLPNQQGTAEGLNNFFNGTMKGLQNYYVHLFRVDHALSENHRIFVRGHYDWWEEDKNRRFGPESLANGIILNRINRGLSLDDVLVLSPSLVLNLRYGLTQQDFTERRISKGFDLSSLGFSPALVGLVDRSVATIPFIGAGQYTPISRWESGDGATNSLTHSFVGHFTKLHASHNLKFGAEFRVYRAFSNRYPQAASPSLNFPNFFTRGPVDNSPAAPIGQELAAMLLGIPGGQMERTASIAAQDKHLGVYLHDDFKLTPKLTLNLGLRYEIESPYTERFDRLVAGFDSVTPNPIDARARANYAAAPIPELPVDRFRALGGLTWVNQAGIGRSPFRGERNNFMPRLGLAWQVRPRTVLRAGYGLFFDTIGVNSTFPIQTGFTQSTPIQASLNEGLSYHATNTNPFPAGLIEPRGAAGGLTTNLGQTTYFYDRGRKHPYSQKWSFGLQQLLPDQFLVDASYVASRGTRLAVERAHNVTPEQYLSRLATRDQGAIDFLSATFPNPFLGTDPIYGARISRGSLLQPYPHFGYMGVTEPIGYSWYHSLQVRGEKRFSRGYTFQLAYTWSKLMEATEFLNPTDLTPYESVSGLDRTHRVAMSGIWEIPFGRGRQFGTKLPGPVNFIAGGWQISTVIVRQAGPPLGFGNAIFNGDVNTLALPKGQRDVDRWFNTEAGFNRNPAQQLGANIRAFPLRFSGLRGDGRATWDFSAIKNFPIREALTLQVRADAYNAWNHANLNPPNTSPTSSAFGRITSAAEGRNFQFSLWLKF